MRHLPRVSVAVFAFVFIVFLSSSCSDQSSPSATDATATVTPSAATPTPTASVVPVPAPTASPSPAATPAPEPVLPAGPFYLPAELPTGWKLTGLRFLGEEDNNDGDATSWIIHPETGGFASGGLTLTITRFPPGSTPMTEPLAVGEVREIVVDGWGPTNISTDRDSGFLSMVATVAGNTSLALSGFTTEEMAVEIAAVVNLGEGDEPTLDLEGWVVEPAGAGGNHYLLDISGPEGVLGVSLNPGSTEASLYLGGAFYESDLQGQVGNGYLAVQRIEEQDLEFPSVRWWLPNVTMSSNVLSDMDVVVEILDSFVEVDGDAFAEAVADLPIQVIEPQSPESEPEENSSPPTASTPVDPETLARLVGFIESKVGRQFAQAPTVSIIDGSELRQTIPEGAFISQSLWDTLLLLGLVANNDVRLDADAARRDQLRGVCCPVIVLDTGDELFNEVVLVHELTHGLDTELGASGGASPELLDPLIALVEGNAHRVAFAYADLLIEDGAQLLPPPNVFPPDGDPRLPWAVQRILEFPYEEGRLFALAVADEAGEPGIVDAFAQPPTTSEQILDIQAYRSGEGAVPLSAPTVPESGQLRAQGSFGAFVLSLLLEDQLGAEQAKELALTWAGDAYVLFDNGGEVCVRASISVDSADAATAWGQAFDATGAEVVFAAEGSDGLATFTTSRCVS